VRLLILEITCIGGSLFNHSQQPNVTFVLDSDTESIRYSTTRDVRAGEELHIFYGHKLWFEDVNAQFSECNSDNFANDEWGGLTAVETWGKEDTGSDTERDLPVPEEDLPFNRVSLSNDPEEENMEAIRRSKYI
jgi:tRNA-specific adenosine deaminase 3